MERVRGGPEGAREDRVLKSFISRPGGEKNNIEMPQVLFCVFYEKSKVKRKRKEIDENGVSG